MFVEENQPTAVPTETSKIILPPNVEIDKSNEIYLDLKSTVLSSSKILNTFFDILNSLDSVVVDEKARFKTAFITVNRTLTLNKDAILQAVDHSLCELTEETDKFKELIKEETIKVNKFSSDINGKNDRIKILKNEIEKLESEIRDIQKTIMTKNESINNTDEKFTVAAKVIEKELIDFKNKFISYTV